MRETGFSAEELEYFRLRRLLNAPWEYPREPEDVILYATADDNLKADIVMELLPEAQKPRYWAEGPYRGSKFGLRLSGPVDQMVGTIEIVDHAQAIYEGIRDKFRSIPDDVLRDPAVHNHPLSVSALIIENELLLEVGSIDPQRAKDIASQYWRYSHSTMYAEEIALEGY